MADLEGYYTVRDIVKKHKIVRSRICYIITERNIKHDGMAGNTRLYSEATYQRIMEEYRGRRKHSLS